MTTVVPSVVFPGYDAIRPVFGYCEEVELRVSGEAYDTIQIVHLIRPFYNEP